MLTTPDNRFLLYFSPANTRPSTTLCTSTQSLDAPGTGNSNTVPGSVPSVASTGAQPQLSNISGLEFDKTPSYSDGPRSAANRPTTTSTHPGSGTSPITATPGPVFGKQNCREPTNPGSTPPPSWMWYGQPTGPQRQEPPRSTVASQFNPPPGIWSVTTTTSQQFGCPPIRSTAVTPPSWSWFGQPTGPQRQEPPRSTYASQFNPPPGIWSVTTTTFQQPGCPPIRSTAVTPPSWSWFGQASSPQRQEPHQSTVASPFKPPAGIWSVTTTTSPQPAVPPSQEHSVNPRDSTEVSWTRQQTTMSTTPPQQPPVTCSHGDSFFLSCTILSTIMHDQLIRFNEVNILV